MAKVFHVAPKKLAKRLDIPATIYTNPKMHDDGDGNNTPTGLINQKKQLMDLEKSEKKRSGGK